MCSSVDTLICAILNSKLKLHVAQWVARFRCASLGQAMHPNSHLLNGLFYFSKQGIKAYCSCCIDNINPFRLPFTMISLRLRKSALFTFLVFTCLLKSILGRPVVRSIRSAHEFDRVLKKHGEETGLPVVVDFYSDGCGPWYVHENCGFH